MPDYQKAKIYRIINDSIPDKVYYGSTCQKLSMRMSTHRCYARSTNNSSKQLFQTGKAIIVLVEDFPCNSKEELHKRERFYIENNDCVNICIPGRTDKEWRTANKDYLKECDKKFSQRRGAKVTCECGSIIRRDSLWKHKKSVKHLKLMETV